MNKKVFCILLILIAFIVLSCGGRGGGAAVSTGLNPNMNRTGLPIVNERETYTIARSRNVQSRNNMEEKEAVIIAERETNISIEWMEIPGTGWTERINIMFASGDLPDAIIRPPLDIFMQNLSQAMDLTDLIDPYAPVLADLMARRPAVRSRITAPDGRIYSLPAGSDVPWNIINDGLFINKVWLDALGLPVPTTTAEFVTALRAFRDNDMNGNGNRNDEIPFGFAQAAVSNSIGSLFGSFGTLMNAEHLRVVNGVVTFTPTEPQFLEALRFFNMLFAEGLMDPEGFSQAVPQYTAKARETNVIYGSLMANLVSIQVGDERTNDYVPVPPLIGPQGHQLWNQVRATGFNIPGFVISTRARSPETLIRWWNYTNETFERAMLWQHGPENSSWEFAPDGRWRNIHRNVPAGTAFEEYWFTVAVGMAQTLMELYDYDMPHMRDLDGDINTNNKLGSVALMTPFLPSSILPSGLEDPDVIRERAILYADINTYVRNFVATSVMQGITDAQWNTHLQNVQRLNIPAYIRGYQDLYDRSR